MTQIEVGRRIAEYRKAHGLTQQRLADRLGVSNKAVSRWERGDSLPDITILSDMAELFGVSIDMLLGGEVELAHNTAHQSDTLYRLMSALSMTCAMLGVILMLSIVYGLGAIVWGVAIGVAMMLVAIVLLAVTIVRIKADWTRDTMRYVFLAIMLIVMSCAMMLPVWLGIRRTFDYNTGEYILSTMSRYTYLDIVLCVIPACVYIWMRYERVFMHYVGGVAIEHFNSMIAVGDSLLAVGAVFFATMGMGGDAMRIIFIVIGVLCMLGVSVTSIVSLIRSGESVSRVYAVRNILLMIPAVMCYTLIEVVDSGEGIAYYLAANYPLWIVFSVLCGLIIIESVVFVMNEIKSKSLQNGKTPTRQNRDSSMK